ncbi:MAG: HDOD domain-containing protein [Gammaproteobacteria bacterium]|nr:HDOD domain-containing protein [Gammaproteobacteria bacterium]
MENLFIARQPIYDRDLAVIGYELLYRSSDRNIAEFDDGDQASCATIINTFMHIGLENLTGSSLAFINLPQQFIVDEKLTPMFKEQSVLEVLEDVEPTPDVIEGLARLKHQGYPIALDDFVYKPELIPLIELANFIKIDVNDKTEADIQQLLKHLKHYDVKIIAEKVETQELYSICQKYDFDYFQGFFFCHPQMVTQRHTPANKLVVMNLLNKLQDAELDYDEFEKVLAQDVTLSYKLLRYINSATFSLRREVDSIKDAVVLLGLNNVRNWISLILMSKVIDSKPNELIVTAMIRGKMCELLAEKYNPQIKPQMFIIGLFSVLDALMDTDMIDLLDTVTLSSPIKMALLDKAGEHGEIYKRVLEYERSNWDELHNIDINADEFIQSYLEAVHWADETMQALR